MVSGHPSVRGTVAQFGGMYSITPQPRRNALDLARKLELFREYYNASRVHRYVQGSAPAQPAGAPTSVPAALDR